MDTLQAPSNTVGRASSEPAVHGVEGEEMMRWRGRGFVWLRTVEQWSFTEHADFGDWYGFIAIRWSKLITRTDCASA